MGGKPNDIIQVRRYDCVGNRHCSLHTYKSAAGNPGPRGNGATASVAIVPAENDLPPDGNI